MARVMIVDDAKFMRMIIRDILLMHGHEVVAEMEHNFRELDRVQDVHVGTIEGDGTVTFDITIKIKQIEEAE